METNPYAPPAEPVGAPATSPVGARPSYVLYSPNLRDDIAEHVFPGSRVVVDLCDDSLTAKKTLAER